jgi:XTP/dITP diphosphohydrolase
MKERMITTLVIATSNTHKLEEIIYILNGVFKEILSLKNFPELGPIRETGTSFRENALLKARTVYRHTGLLTLADDSGLEVDALKGAPGIYSARFAGREHDYAANNRKLLQELKNIPDEKRGAQFRCVVAMVGENIDRVAEGIVPGHIIHEMRGSGGFGYDPLFIPNGFDRTYAELGESVKNRISHRAIAFTRAKEILLELIET